MMNRRIIYVIPIAAVVIAASLFFAASMAGMNNSQVSGASTAGCLPADTDSLANAKFEVRKPAESSLPAGYRLEAVDDATFVVSLYYSDREICKPGEISSELANGTLVIQEGYNPDLTDEQKMADDNAKGVFNATNGEVQPQVIDINGHKGVVIPAHMGKDRIMLDGKVIHEEPIQMPAAVMLFNADEKIQYYITAHRSTDELVQIAKSIP
ncbi:hypothetical protein [Nitrososphaera viennensis]|uniref:Uncharacterized protein n=2 Tax=Nitrososphaera viennensis TaxID=1034015 RepID=A0A060HJI1_9ARCH|nr:hypothetical protein [Nitrososphaera viennensis]AIC15400.1 exported protein of unknown function [Nitrososphaera viennensis EN76]UVS70294.1 hypothetical protein NWT39_05785 [Nitrososphaera viennensis]